MKPFVAILSALFLSLSLHSLPAHAAHLDYGKYFGTLQMEGHPEAIAVTLDAFVTQGSDPKAYPALDVIVRVNLGGYFGPEYVGYAFHDPTFNFEKGILDLNDPKENLAATLQITNAGSETILEGPVLERLTNSRGTLRVIMSVDGGSEASLQKLGPRSAPFLSELRGEYRGNCGGLPADLQIETGRAFQPDLPGNALSGYSITGRLGLTQGPLCAPGRSGFCSLYPYTSGTYSPFSNRLTLQNARGTLDCGKANDELRCNLNGFYASGPCTLSKTVALVATEPAQIPTGFYLDVPTTQKAPLPSPNPPDNQVLLQSLNGTFYGFLHHENRDQYQLIEMNVIATTSTENPHIQNRVMIEPTLLIRAGDSWDSTPIQSLFFPQRAFYLDSGLVLENGATDLFAVIGDWRVGYLSGVLYSRSYGRIGTFELQKGLRPPVRTKMVIMETPLGSYRGPQETSSPLHGFWSLSVGLPNDGSGSSLEGAPLRGRYQGTNVMGAFDAASMDINTGALTFLIKSPAGDRLVTGTLGQDRSLKLIWPVGPAIGAPMGAYQVFTYSRQSGEEN